MENHTPNTEVADALGITSTTLTSTPLDEAYLDSLFTADPDEVTQLEPATEEPEPVSSKPAADAAKKEKPEQVPPNPSTPESFIVDDPDFVEGLSAENNNPAKPDATPKEKKQEPTTKSAPPDPTSAGEEDIPQTGAPAAQEHLSSFARELFQIGVLTADEQEDVEKIQITTPQALVERLNHEKKKGAVQILENILSQFGPEYREAFNAIYIDGVHPRDYFTQAESVESLADLDLSKAEHQKYVLSRYYRTLGWDEPKINAKIEKLENYQDLEEEARDIHGTLLAKERQALTDTQERKKEELARKAATEQEYQASVQRILKEKLKARELDGIPVDEKTARELAGYMLQKKWQLADQQISDFEKDVLDLTRPEHRELQIKVALLMHILKSDPTLSRLGRKAITAQTNNMFSFLQREQSTAKKQGKKVTNFFDD